MPLELSIFGIPAKLRAAVLWLLRRIQIPALIAVLAPPLSSLGDWLDEFIGNWRYLYREELYLGGFVLGLIGLVALYRASLHRFVSERILTLLVLPACAVISWYPFFHSIYDFGLFISGHTPTFHQTFQVGDKTGCLDTQGKVVLPAIYDAVDCWWVDMSSRSSSPSTVGFDLYPVSLYAVRQDSQWGFIDRHFHLKIEPQFDDISGESMDYRKPTQYHNHKPVIWDESPFVSGLAAVEKNGSWGFISMSGKAVVPFQYEDALPFSDHFNLPRPLAAVKRNGKWGYIDRNNQLQIPFTFDEAGKFGPWWALTGTQASAPVRQGQFWGAIDPSGRFLLKPVLPFRPSFYHCNDRKCKLKDEVTGQEVQVTEETHWTRCGDQWTSTSQCPAAPTPPTASLK